MADTLEYYKQNAEAFVSRTRSKYGHFADSNGSVLGAGRVKVDCYF